MSWRRSLQQPLSATEMQQIQQAIQGNGNVQIAMGDVHLKTRSTPWGGLTRQALLTAKAEELHKIQYWTRRKWVNGGALAFAVAILFFVAVTVRLVLSLMQLPQAGLAGLLQIGTPQTLILSVGSVLFITFTQAWWHRHLQAAKAEINAARQNLQHIQHELRRLDLTGR